jgi:folate-binding protein YgfZ
VPADLGPADLPAEGGLVDEAVSFTKGCFLGQEVVARMHHVGRARRALRIVSGGGEVPAAPAPLQAKEDGRAAGELRSAAAAGAGRWLGLAMLKGGPAEAHGRLLLEGREVVAEEGGAR